MSNIKHLMNFAYKVERDVKFLLITIQAITNIIITYGPTLENNNGPILVVYFPRIIQTLVDLMYDVNVEIQGCAGVCLCKLISSERIHSPSLISQMILKWCYPPSDLETKYLKESIEKMLESLPSLTNSVNQLEEAILPTIKTLLGAPKSSPLVDVNVLDIIKFMLTLCNLCNENSNVHSNLAVSICGEMKNDPQQNHCNFILSETLLMLHLPSDNKQLVRGLNNVCEELRDEIQNPSILHNIAKFKAELEQLLIL